jgi:integrase/recombinase XerD
MPKKGSHTPPDAQGDPNDPHGWHVLTESFLEWMGVQNYSPRTIHGRRTYLKYFIAWSIERGLTRPAEITKPILERYQRHLFHHRKRDGEPMGVRSQHARLVPVRAFFKWAARANHLLYNPASEIDLPRLDHRLPKHILSTTEVEKILALCPTNPATDPSGLGLRDRAILETFYSTGMRRSELMNLKLHDIDPERGTLFIRQGKGRKDRMVPVGDRALHWITRYRDDIRPQYVREPDSGTLFLTNLYEPFTPNRLTQLVRDYINGAELGKSGSCHLFRHTCATLMLENGADIRFIQQLLGHAELTTTQIYTQVSIQKLKQVHSACHPSSSLEKPADRKTKKPPKPEPSAEPTPSADPKPEPPPETP